MINLNNNGNDLLDGNILAPKEFDTKEPGKE